jgi:hypothetical protein
MFVNYSAREAIIAVAIEVVPESDALRRAAEATIRDWTWRAPSTPLDRLLHIVGMGAIGLTFRAVLTDQQRRDFTVAIDASKTVTGRAARAMPQEVVDALVRAIRRSIEA